jgi:hypothetical protein
MDVEVQDKDRGVPVGQQTEAHLKGEAQQVKLVHVEILRTQDRYKRWNALKSVAAGEGGGADVGRRMTLRHFANAYVITLLRLRSNARTSSYAYTHLNDLITISETPCNTLQRPVLIPISTRLLIPISTRLPHCQPRGSLQPAPLQIHQPSRPGPAPRPAPQPLPPPRGMPVHLKQEAVSLHDS